jgi:hypothetical protein
MVRYTGTKLAASVARNSRSSICFKNAKPKRNTMAKPQAKQLVVCVSDEGYPASLEKRKIYVALRDAEAKKLTSIHT